MQQDSSIMKNNELSTRQQQEANQLQIAQVTNIEKTMKLQEDKDIEAEEKNFDITTTKRVKSEGHCPS
ncbi:6255_t:CDS:2 [Dentiscutata heterogama]|uniref:6255_t:CDS:1 n=1 Tax=Dentiscutata heterogama TaxID=1316150 RepID=A0ACA9KA56_9GLOM|nr:6255_t:CDS:2 [Dentiscutata heterogama]